MSQAALTSVTDEVKKGEKKKKKKKGVFDFAITCCTNFLSLGVFASESGIYSRNFFSLSLSMKCFLHFFFVRSRESYFHILSDGSNHTSLVKLLKNKYRLQVGGKKSHKHSQTTNKCVA